MELKSSNDTIKLDESSRPAYRGGGSQIFRYNGLLVKVFHVVNNKSTSILSEDDFDLLKTIKHENFIDLVERYHRVPQTSELVEAYTYHEIEGETFNFLECATEFCVDQLGKLYSLFDDFSEYGIKLADVRESNTLVLSDRIVLIDPDFFKFYGTSANLKDFNRNQFLYLVLSYFFHYNGNILPDIVEGCFDKSNPVDVIAKRLLPYKTPLDYIQKTIR